jgi:hypothetical protein
MFFRFLKNVIGKEVPEFHACLEYLITRLLVFLCDLLAVWWSQIGTLDQIVKADIREILQDLDVLVLFHRVCRLLN